MGYMDILGSDVDIMGDDDVGDDLADLLGEDDILGAGRRRGGRSSAVKRLMQRRGTLVRTERPTNARRLTVGVDSGATLILAGAASTIVVQPVEPFRTELFSVNPTIAPQFLITQVLVGRKSQLVGTGSINASAFASNNPLSAVQWDTAQTAQPLSIAVLNNSLESLRFMATLFGTTVSA